MASSLRVLVVDEEPGIRDGMAFSLKRAGFVVEQARNGEEALHLLRPGAFDAVVSGAKWSPSLKPGRAAFFDSLLLSSRLSSVITGLPILHVLTPPAVGHPIEHPYLTQVFASIVKPFSPESLVAALWRTIRGDDHLKAETWGDGLVLLTQDKAYAENLYRARRAAESRANVVIEAEQGSDGERLARLIHLAGNRKAGPWVTVRCGVDTSLDSFPIIRDPIGLPGSYPSGFHGDDDAVSLLNRADGGTLLLDEVSALSSAQQEWLLHRLRDRLERGVGRTPARDIRVIALTSKDLVAEVEAGRFKEELRYFLNVVPVRIPPMRERLQDVSMLASHVAEHFARTNARPAIRLAPSFLLALARHEWPGNVRELESAVMRAAALAKAAFLTKDDLAWLLPPNVLAGIPPDPEELLFRPRTEFQPSQPSAPSPSMKRGPISELKQEAVFADPKVPTTTTQLGTLVALPLGLALPDLERFWLLSTLAAVDGNRTRCAQLLGVALRTVRNKLNEYRAQGFTIPAAGRDRDEE
ncbi:MAG: sigma-54-dependent Fis family transcriptional regulator [Holophagaceae bacterium]|nr:sigma-54-dependent Fis family transcriptional regulator [Holophagaceae bacterium]